MAVQKTQILKLTRHNQKQEREFEVRFLQSLTITQRFAFMRQKSQELRNLLESHGHRRTLQIVKRASC